MIRAPLRGAGLAGLALLLGGCVAVVPFPLIGVAPSDAPPPAEAGAAPAE